MPVVFGQKVAVIRSPAAYGVGLSVSRLSEWLVSVYPMDIITLIPAWVRIRNRLLGKRQAVLRFLNRWKFLKPRIMLIPSPIVYGTRL